MSSSADIGAESYDGERAEALARSLGVPHIALYRQVGSTLDVAHALAPEAPSGTLILADEQVAGRGRHGRRWTSRPGAGVWLTIIERPRDLIALDVLALRCGLYAAEALDQFASAPVRVKWPNDLHVEGRKLAGVLIETRWRGLSPEWVAIGFGLNVKAPDDHVAAGLRAGIARLDAVKPLVQALRRAAAAKGPLSNAECAEWAARDIAVGRQVTEPAAGVVQGLSAAGEIRIREADGVVRAYRSGSLTFAAPASCS